MNNDNLDTYCGLYCGACDILIAYKTGHKSRFAAFWDETTLRKLQEAQGCHPTEADLAIKCHGCKSDTVFINCRSCVLRSCAIEHQVEHCTDCAEYPCEITANFKKGEKVLPHLVSKEANLETIHDKGEAAWLKEQEKRWQCPDCGEPFSWYTERCNRCGKDLIKSAYRFSWFQAFFFRLGMRDSLKR